MGFRVNDTVTLAYPAGSTETNCIPAADYFVKTYDASTGVMTVSSTAGGAAVTAQHLLLLLLEHLQALHLQHH